MASSLIDSSAVQPWSSPASTATRNAFSAGGVRLISCVVSFAPRIVGRLQGPADGPRRWRGHRPPGGRRLEERSTLGGRPHGHRAMTAWTCSLRPRQWIRAREVEPGDVRLAPEPRALTLREGHVAVGVGGDRRITGHAAVEDCEGLRIPDRGQRPKILCVATSADGGGLVDEASVELLAGSFAITGGAWRGRR